MAAQPPNSWTIQLINSDGTTAGAPMTLAPLGIETATIEFNNLAADVMSLKVGGLEIDAATLWNYGQLLALIDPYNVRRFFGRVEPWSREGTPDTQDHIGRIVNPWWYFENKAYQQRYNIPIFNTDEQITGYDNYTTPRVVLYVLYNGAPVDGSPATGFYQATTGQQIQDVINWCVDQGAPMQLGQMDPATTPFASMQKGIICSEVFKHAFRFEPDFKVWWDYTTTPFPTINCLKQASFVPLTIDLTSPGVREKITVKERPDWQKSYVAIFYDQTESVNGQQYIDLADDYYPNPLVPSGGMSQADFNFRGVDLFCDLTGEKVGQQQQQANFASEPFSINSLATWQDWHPHLNPANDPTIDSVFLITGPAFSATSITLNYKATVNGYAAPAIAAYAENDSEGNPLALDPTCTNEIVDGSWADWIAGGAGYTGPVYGELSNLPAVPNGQRVRATAFVLVIHKLPANAQPGENPKWEAVPLAHDFTATNINTGGVSQNFTSTTQTVTQYAEPIPYGLAEYMFQSWQNLSLEGKFQNTEAVIGSTQAISGKNCLNFNTPKKPAWASANAVIQRMTWDIYKGASNVEFGAPLKLRGNALIDAIRASRFRITTIDLAYIFGGAIASGTGTTRFARKHHHRASVPGRENKQVEKIGSQPTGTGTGAYVSIDSTVTIPSGAPATIAALINASDIQAAWQANTTAPTS
jgi:hypothetical protein